jgi:hypothetical protein
MRLTHGYCEFAAGQRDCLSTEQHEPHDDHQVIRLPESVGVYLLTASGKRREPALLQLRIHDANQRTRRTEADGSTSAQDFFPEITWPSGSYW